jgi:hydrogenase maturation protein HypF
LRAEIKVKGIVQGVGFRPFVYRLAVSHGLVGYVRNRGDAMVEITVEGNRSHIRQFVTDLQNKKPSLARIYDIHTRYTQSQEKFAMFTIIKSTEKTEHAGSIIPPDVAICEECQKELKNPSDPRHEYFFITCTNCGPRYTIIDRLPYDRANTTMRDFEMCPFCKTEFEDPLNRRFHAQTVACPVCGPKAYLTTRGGERMDEKDPIRQAGKLLEEGSIIAVKGYGGFHVATATTNSTPIEKLRQIKHRSQKPFAIMACSLDTVKTFAEVSKHEEEVLTSYIHPIVLLNKSENYFLSDQVSPKLHNVGVMLPYTGMHIMLFDKVKEPAFVMTSANPPNEPIIKDNEEALERLGNTVDYFLFHNREIAHRCDDSVIRWHGSSVTMIRRSRGYAPEPIQLKKAVKTCVLGMGAEQNVTACILLGDKAFISQHIGDVENVETLEFLRNTISHLIQLTNSKTELIACDVHPKFSTTILAQTLGTKLNCPVIPVQHHHAHIAALMAEHGVNEMVGIACDGFGYGTDGKAWGGEILQCDSQGFARLAYLQEQPMLGGDLATRYPIRMVAGILHEVTNIDDWLFENSAVLPHGRAEAEIILDQLKKGNVQTTTTSCGRILDAIAVLLNVCSERTYEGEPAMKLESAAIKGRDVLKLEPRFEGNTLNTTWLVKEVFEQRNKHSPNDLACSAQLYLARGVARLATQEARRLGIENVGFSGGVAYNQHITSAIRRSIEENKLRFFVHEKLPAGDGCISLGQAYAACTQEGQKSERI